MSLSPASSPPRMQLAAMTAVWTNGRGTGVVAVEGGAKLATASRASVLVFEANGEPNLVVYAEPGALPTVRGPFDRCAVAPAEGGCAYSPSCPRAPSGEPLRVWQARDGGVAAVFYEHTICGVIVCRGCGTPFASFGQWQRHTGIALPAAAYGVVTGKHTTPARLRLEAKRPVDVESTRVGPAALAEALRRI